MKKKMGILLVITIVLVIMVSTKLNNNEKVKDNNKELKTNTYAFYIEQTDGTYKEIKDIPNNGYIINKEKSACSNGSKVSGITPNITINNLSKSGTSCYLYFDMYSAKNYILANNEIDMSRISGEFTSTFESDTTGRIFKGPADDYGDTTYIFAGANPNNWVKFAGFYWRIIRINGDGTIRLIYNGNTIDPTGEGTQIGTSAFNTNYNDNAYVGYMYGEAGQSGENAYTLTHANTNNSTIKGVLDTWYENNIGNNTAYSSKIEPNVGFCGDRSLNTTSETWWSMDTKNGYGAQATAYGPYGRVRSYNGSSNVWRTTQTATLKCKQSNDLYTTSSASIGNKKLTKPIGLITMDEVKFAGGFGGKYNTSYWLYTNQYYWTMSPSSFYSGHAFVFRVDSNGYLGNPYVSNTNGVRPVINLKADTQLTGSGTTINPYVVG